MIKELTENPDKRFTNSKVPNGAYVALNPNNIIYWYGIEQTIRPLEIDMFDAKYLEWEEVKEPVDFMTAVASGKRIKHEKWADFYELHEMFDGMSLISDNSSRKTILGKWYVED